jgi:hypothetical protein
MMRAGALCASTVLAIAGRDLREHLPLPRAGPAASTLQEGQEEHHLARTASDNPLNPDCSKCRTPTSGSDCCTPYSPSEMGKCSTSLPDSLQGIGKMQVRSPVWQSFVTRDCHSEDPLQGHRGPSQGESYLCDPCRLSRITVRANGMLYCEIPDQKSTHLNCFNATPIASRFTCMAGEPNYDVYGGWKVAENPVACPRIMKRREKRAILEKLEIAQKGVATRNHKSYVKDVPEMEPDPDKTENIEPAPPVQRTTYAKLKCAESGRIQLACQGGAAPPCADQSLESCEKQCKDDNDCNFFTWWNGTDSLGAEQSCRGYAKCVRDDRETCGSCDSYVA